MLGEALESVQTQTHGDLEILVCDDASTDTTTELVQSAQESDARIRYRRNATRLGVSRNIHQGIMASTGDFFAICNDDDVWEPDFLGRSVAIMEEYPDVGTVFTDHWIMDRDGTIDNVATDANSRQWGRSTLPEGLHAPFARLALVDQSVSPAVAALFRTSAIDTSDFPEAVGGNYDIWLGYLASRDGGSAWYIPARLTRYRVHGGSATAGGGIPLARSSAFVWERLLADPRLAPIHADLRRKLGRSLTSLGARLLRVGSRPEARWTLRKAFVVQPTVEHEPMGVGIEVRGNDSLRRS